MNQATEEHSLAGKKVIVTGGTTGIGRAIAHLLAKSGCDVLIFGRHDRELADALADAPKSAGKIIGLTTDVTKKKDIQRVWHHADMELGGLDILVNNAALGGDDMLESDFDEWKYVLDTNIVGYIAFARGAIERMKKNCGGHIVNIGSISAEKKSAGGEIYVASKSAIRGWSASLAKTVREDAIRVTLIEPGLVGSDMVDYNVAEQREKIAGKSMLKAEDIAECVLFCLTRPERCTVGFVQIGPQFEDD